MDALQRDTDSDDDLLPRSTSPSAYRRAHQRDAQQQPQPGSQDIDAQRLDAGDARRRFGEATRARLDRQQQRGACGGPALCPTHTCLC